MYNCLEGGDLSRTDKHIDSFDYLRVIGMLLIFFNHVWGYVPYKLPDFGVRAVDIFFMISGFVACLNTRKIVDDNIIRDTIQYVIRKIKKFYPLHLITVLCILLISTFNFKIFVLNFLLLQSWVPDKDVYWGYNGVSWFLSSLLFCFVCFPALRKYLRMSTKKMFALVMILGLVETSSLLLEKLGLGDYNGYLYYIFPCYCLLLFILGMFLCHAYKYVKQNAIFISNRKLAFFVLLCWLIYIFICDIRWTRFTFLFIESLLLICFAMLPNNNREGVASKVIRFLSSISFDFYLIHHVVIIYYGYYRGLFLSMTLPYYIDVLIMLTISLIIAIVWHEIYGYVIGRAKGFL